MADYGAVKVMKVSMRDVIGMDEDKGRELNAYLVFRHLLQTRWNRSDAVLFAYSCFHGSNRILCHDDAEDI